MKNLSRLIVVSIMLITILGGLFGWKTHQIKQQQLRMSQAQPPVQVEATRVLAKSWQDSLSALGSVRAVNGIRLANEIAGVVESIHFESGQRVKAGDELLRLDSDTDAAALQTLQAEQHLAEQQFNRFSNLIRSKAISQADFDEAKANLEAAKARVHEQQANLNKKRIRAPFDGTAGLRLVSLGQFLEVGTPIVQISMRDPIYVDFSIPERDMPHIAVGNQVEVKIAASPGRTFAGKISALEASVNTDSRTLQVRAELPNPERLLWPGMFAEVSILRAEYTQVLTVPRTAISYNTYGDFVYVIETGSDGKSTVQRRSVTTGAVRDGRVALTAGVEGDTQVVATGLLRLRNGQAVRIVDSSINDRVVN